MAVVITAPTGQVRIFDRPMFSATGASGDYSLTIAGVTVKLSAKGGSLSFNTSGVLKALFKHSELLNGTTSKAIAWTLTQTGTTVGSGSFTAIYGSSKVLAFPVNGEVNLKWIDSFGVVQTRTLKTHQSAKKVENISQYDSFLVNMIKEEKVSLYLPLIDAAEYNTLSSIYSSVVVQAQTTQGWEKVEVERKELKKGKAPLQDFELNVIFSDER